ncbi:hypothetical protein Taro_003797 [Colocasia esculenta]|uniref:Uncharacterized protein n=1 Tax=Colocasia esculenta TaxID=4460 RepID=A0A843TPS7_COLES|nr:hypothetical protein [Colocasia esculenta]
MTRLARLGRIGPGSASRPSPAQPVRSTCKDRLGYPGSDREAQNRADSADPISIRPRVRERGERAERPNGAHPGGRLQWESPLEPTHRWVPHPTAGSNGQPPSEPPTVSGFRWGCPLDMSNPSESPVTNVALVEEVINNVPAKNGRIKDDVYIYMVLEYGEIDLAHMLLQKWKDFDRSSWKMDENWLRFYWQSFDLFGLERSGVTMFFIILNEGGLLLGIFGVALDFLFQRGACLLKFVLQTDNIFHLCGDLQLLRLPAFTHFSNPGAAKGADHKKADHLNKRKKGSHSR